MTRAQWLQLYHNFRLANRRDQKFLPDEHCRSGCTTGNGVFLHCMSWPDRSRVICIEPEKVKLVAGKALGHIAGPYKQRALRREWVEISRLRRPVPLPGRMAA